MNLDLRPSLAVALTVALAWPTAGSAQPAKGSPEHIQAAVAQVDGALHPRQRRARRATGPATASTTPRRASRARQINAANVKDLGLVWSYDLESTRGVEATPLVVDGIMYVTASWSIVHAIDVRTGKRLWTFDPQGRPREGATRAAATSSTAAWRCTRARSSSPPTTAA